MTSKYENPLRVFQVGSTSFGLGKTTTLANLATLDSVIFLAQHGLLAVFLNDLGQYEGDTEKLTRLTKEFQLGLKGCLSCGSRKEYLEFLQQKFIDFSNNYTQLSDADKKYMSTILVSPSRSFNYTGLVLVETPAVDHTVESRNFHIAQGIEKSNPPIHMTSLILDAPGTREFLQEMISLGADYVGMTRQEVIDSDSEHIYIYPDTPIDLVKILSGSSTFSMAKKNYDFGPHTHSSALGITQDSLGIKELTPLNGVFGISWSNNIPLNSMFIEYILQNASYQRLKGEILTDKGTIHVQASPLSKDISYVSSNQFNVFVYGSEEQIKNFISIIEKFHQTASLNSTKSFIKGANISPEEANSIVNDLLEEYGPYPKIPCIINGCVSTEMSQDMIKMFASKVSQEEGDKWNFQYLLYKTRCAKFLKEYPNLLDIDYTKARVGFILSVHLLKHILYRLPVDVVEGLEECNSYNMLYEGLLGLINSKHHFGIDGNYSQTFNTDDFLGSVAPEKKLLASDLFQTDEREPHETPIRIFQLLYNRIESGLIAELANLYEQRMLQVGNYKSAYERSLVQSICCKN